ncbi:uncharacterized protein LOC111528594 [Piliocolobus tephrosceles]|uniref:uncharacterized protein LOC111528594 n=1 Tax=Piliocolobus tephrosceles TaxID=591936 RepID=UPI000E6AEDDD|nr:uncharacterized protein LOC111528594 [Piliocolobus tephrosceles]
MARQGRRRVGWTPRKMPCGRERLAVGLVSRQGRAIALPSSAGMARQGWHGSRCPVLRKPVIAGPRRCSPQFFGPGFLQVDPAYRCLWIWLRPLRTSEEMAFHGKKCALADGRRGQSALL